MPTTIVNTGRRARAAATRFTAFFTETNATGSAASYDSVAAPGEGKRIVVMAVQMSANATVVVTFRSDLVDRGQRPTTAGAAIFADGGDHGLFELAENKKLVIGLNANATVGGWITYVIEDV